MQRRDVILAGALSLAAPGVLRAQGRFPDRPVRLVMPYQPGGATDIVARLFARKLTEVFGQNVVVENRSGGSGQVGGTYVQRAAPDGYTLMFNASVHVISPLLMKNSAFDAVRDFQPVAQVARGPLLFTCHPSVTARSLAELAQQAKAAPDRFTFCTSSRGSAGHLCEEMFKQISGADILVAPYNGSAPALADLSAGRVNLMIDPILSSLPFARDGRTRALALTSARRAPVAADVPTAAEAGMPELEFYSWYGVWAPLGIPADLLKTISDALIAATRSEEASNFLNGQGFEPTGIGPAEFASFISSEVAKYRTIITNAKIEPE